MIKPLGTTGSTGSTVSAVAPSARVDSSLGEAGRALLVVDTSVPKAPPLMLGEIIAARVIERLPNERLLVQIKGGLLTLQLPAPTRDSTPAAGDSANATDAAASKSLAQAGKGDGLSLKVASLSPRLAFVLAAAAGASSASGSTAVKLSDAARYVTELLHAAASESGPGAPSALASAGVLLADPQASAAQRAASLAQAIERSGLFYESHLRAWAEGRLPLDRLRSEPQARAAEGLKDTSRAVREGASAELGGLLQRQLDGLDGKPLAFVGFAWPGQRVEWRVQRDPDDKRGDQREDEAAGERDANGPARSPTWTTQLDLELPRLGTLGAQVRVVGSQVTLAMTLASAASAELLRAHRARLAAALQTSGLTLAALTLEPAAVRHEQAEEP
jgi:Flagellar hook-length control protein FliK